MKKHKHFLLLGTCILTLSACGGGSEDNKPEATVVSHVTDESSKFDLDTFPAILPEVGIYTSALITRSHPHKLIKGIDGMTLVYPGNDTEQRWNTWVDDGSVATWWLGKAARQADKNGKYPVRLTRVSRSKTPDSFIIKSDGAEPELLPSPYQMQSSDTKYITFQTQPMLDDQGEDIRYIAFNFSSTGTSTYHDWSGQVALIPVKIIPVITDNWHDNNGFTTDMLGDVETTSNGGKLTVSMQLPSAGCTLTGEGDVGNKLSKLNFTGFSKCKFNIPDEANWSQSEYKNTHGLMNVKSTAVAYATAIKNSRGVDTLVIGFPELDGVIFKVEKRLALP